MRRRACIKADQLNTMVKAAIAVVQNAPHVKPPRVAVDAYADRAAGRHRLGERLLVTRIAADGVGLRHRLVAGDGGRDRALVEATLAAVPHQVT